MRSWRSSSQSMAAYRSSSSNGPKPSVSARVSRAVASASPRAVASLEPGSRMRAATIASTRARSGEGAGSMSRSRRRVRAVPSTAATWPWGTERTMSKASSRPTSGSSLRSRRRVSTLPLGHLERLARVRFLTLPFSRQPSRSRMAGGEFRLGTVSIYMATTVLDPAQKNNRKYHHYMGTFLHRPIDMYALQINPLDRTERQELGGTSA